MVVGKQNGKRSAEQVPKITSFQIPQEISDNLAVLLLTHPILTLVLIQKSLSRNETGENWDYPDLKIW